MLVDSGSSSSFVGQHLIGVLPGAMQLTQPIQVNIADGGILDCDMEFANCQWLCQGNTF